MSWTSLLQQIGRGEKAVFVRLVRALGALSLWLCASCASAPNPTEMLQRFEDQEAHMNLPFRLVFYASAKERRIELPGMPSSESRN